MSVASVRAGQATVEINADDSKLVRGLNAAKGKMASWVPSIKSILGGVAGYFSAKAFTGLITGAANAASEIQDLADRTGISARSISTLKYAAEQTGTDLGGLQMAMKNIAKELDAGGDAFKKYGIDVDRFRQLSPEDQFKTVAEAVSRVTDPTARAAAALDLLGKSGQDLIPLISGGAAGISQLQAEAERLGLAMTNADAAAGEKFGDSLATLGSQVQAVGTKIMSVLIPHLQPLIDKTIEASAAFLKWIDEVRPKFDEFLTVVSERSGMAIDAIRAIVAYMAGGELLNAVNVVVALFKVDLYNGIASFLESVQQMWETSFVNYLIESTKTVMREVTKAFAMAKVLTGDVAGGMAMAARAEKIGEGVTGKGVGAALTLAAKKQADEAKKEFAKLVGGAGNDLKALPESAKRRQPLPVTDPVTDVEKLRVASVGTFNARAASGLAGNTDTAAIRVATQQTAQNTARLANAGGANNLAFAP